MATESTLIKSTRVCTYPIADNSYRKIGLGWRKGSEREEEFRLLGNFMSDNR
jgi:LysR family hydrogen peroxide-inducible transcriptional activator